MTQSEREEFFSQALSAETTSTLFEIGCEQLKHAISHFYRGEFVVATTLAGAADEILGRIAKAKTNENAVDRFRRWYIKVMRLVDHPEEPTLKDVKNDLNTVRNELKHNDTGSNGTITRQIGAAALKLIDSAVLNIIIIEGFQPPVDSEIARYHAESPTWNGSIPEQKVK